MGRQSLCALDRMLSIPRSHLSNSQVCWKGVGVNSILCLSYKKWVPKRFSGIWENLRNCKDFICKTNSTVAYTDDPFPTCITIDANEFETVAEFYFLCDIKGQAGGCIDTVTGHIWSAWEAFHELLPVLKNRGISLLNRGKVFKACVRCVLLHGSETWPMSTDLSHIKTSNYAMSRWICDV